ncbi:hypothetical protein GCK72_016756 [Caenorhabditis remanei]|uniref:Zinc metalloproteinase n=1 Tax=Caenorhabditis remanei TaxID=31234 RepID=A0A6A5G6V2_CAERE|nr:hypothetical protein GCK72_016756 [Caenorhabditis remanei]KAF1750209.1 hypothetical protein GCK72_016756 [Caenorhabditis remanei]
MLIQPIFILLSFSFILGTANHKYAEKEIEGLIEGDIQLTDVEGNRVKRQISSVEKKWPNGVVSYYFDNGINETSRLIIRSAMNYISARTCVTFVESSTASDRIKILNDDCSSPVGMKGGEQGLRLGDKCVTFGMAVHHIMHALGIYNTNQRTDRDEYLTVNLTNVPEWLWQELNINDTTNNVTPFEHGSVMMLPEDVYENGTIESKELDYNNTLGFRRVTFYDMMMLNSHYSCSCAVDLACKNGGRTNPAKCSECLCPAGYAGTLCDQPPPGTQMYYTDVEWKQNITVFGKVDSDLPIGEPRMTYIWITAPEDKAIQMRVVHVYNCTCEPGCNSNGVEPKCWARDPAIVHPIYCCESDRSKMNRVTQSYLNPTPVVMHERSGECTAIIEYRHVTPAPTTPSTTTTTTTTPKPTTTPTTTTTTTPAPVTTTKPKDCHSTATQTTTCKCTTTHTKMYETEECRIAAGGQCSSTTVTGGRKTVTKCSSDTTNI